MNSKQRRHPIIPRYEPTNRREKRLLMNEYKRNVEDLLSIEYSFLTDLFDEDHPLSYEELYTMYLDQFNDKIEWLRKNRRFKYTQENPNYFPYMYFPKEKILADNLNNIIDTEN